MQEVSIIAALDSDGGIGRAGQLPWSIPEDMRHFRETTTGHVVVMGRKTYESIGKPLPNRINIVVTRDPGWYPFSEARNELYTAYNLSNALVMASIVQGKKVFVIGGAQIYQEAMQCANELIITRVPGSYNCDAFFPAIPGDQWERVEERVIYLQGFPAREVYVDLGDNLRAMRICTYRRANHAAHRPV